MKNIKAKITELKRLRELALQGRRELHQRRHDLLYRDEYITYGKCVDECNARILELDAQLV